MSTDPYHDPLCPGGAYLAAFGILLMSTIIGLAIKDVWAHPLLYSHRIPEVQHHHYKDVFFGTKFALWFVLCIYYGIVVWTFNICDDNDLFRTTHKILYWFLVIYFLFFLWECEVTGKSPFDVGANPLNYYLDPSRPREDRENNTRLDPQAAPQPNVPVQPQHPSPPAANLQMRLLPTRRPDENNANSWSRTNEPLQQS